MDFTRGNKYVATIFNYKRIDVLTLEGIEAHEYWVAAPEVCPTTQRPHLQVYGILKKKGTRREQIYKLYDKDHQNFHIEQQARYSKNKEASDYCTGPWESPSGDKQKPYNPDCVIIGKLPEDGHVIGGKKTAERWKKSLEDVQNGVYDGDNLDITIPYAKHLEYVARKLQNPDPLSEPSGILIWGDTGTAKTTLAQLIGTESLYTKECGKWWDGYNNEENVVMDDVKPEDLIGLESSLKRWTDKNPFTGETKGGNTGRIRPKRFIITSQYPLDQLFRDEPTYKAMERRCTVIEASVHRGVWEKNITKRRKIYEEGGKEVYKENGREITKEEFLKSL